MGLDQYIYKEMIDEKDEEGKNKTEEIHYWRKNYALNDWACWHWCPDDIADFNCERLYLNEYKLEEIITHILFNMEKKEVGDIYNEGFATKDLLETLMDCKNRIKSGETLFYLAWW